MAQRNSERLNLGDGGGESAIQAQAPGVVQPRMNPEVFGSQVANIPGRPATVQAIPIPLPQLQDDPLVRSMFGSATRLANTMVDKGLENAYLEGAAAVGAGVAEDELNTNPLTAAWTTAGYKDTVGRLSIADYEADVAQDMAAWQEKSPTEYSSYLAGKRNKLMGQFEGMSTKARGTVFNQLLMSERASVRTHAKEYGKFVVQTQARQAATTVSTVLNRMTLAQDDQLAYEAAGDASFAAVHATLWENDRFLPAMKSNLIGEAVEKSLNQGHTGLYERLNSIPVSTLPDGTKATMFDQMDQQIVNKLHKQYRTTMGQTEAIRMGDFHRNLADMTSSFGNITQPQVSREQLDAVLAQGKGTRQFAGALSPEQEASIRKQWAVGQEKIAKHVGAANAYFNGDYQWLANNQVTREQSVKDADLAMQMRGKDLPERVLNHLVVGGQTGNDAALKFAGESMKPIVSAMMTSKEPIKSNSQLGVMLTNLSQHLDGLTKEGSETSLSTLMSALPDDERLFLNRTISLVRDQGNPVDRAVETARTLMLTDLNMDKHDKAQRVQEKAKERDELIASVDERHWFGSAVLQVKEWVGSAEAKTMRGLRPDTGFWGTSGNSYGVSELKAQAQEEYSRSLNARLLTNPTLDKGLMKSDALADLEKRRVPTQFGQVFLPRGVDAQSYFKTPAVANPEMIGNAINEMVRPETQNGVLKYTARDGKLLVTEYTTSGNTITRDAINPEDVGKMVNRGIEERGNKSDKLYGEGVTRTGNTGVSVSYNGDNSAGIPPHVALHIRDTLVKFEGVLDRPKPDSNKSSTTNIGVGINSVNKNREWYPRQNADGTIGPEENRRSFMGASNDFMKPVVAVTQTFRIPQTQDNLAMLTNIAYQAGENFATDPKHGYYPLLIAMGKQDADTAVRELRKTSAYKVARNPNKPNELSARQKYYEDVLYKMKR